jgi:hypothetical protein
MIYLVNFVPNRGLFDPSPQKVIDKIQGPPTRLWWHHLRDTWIIVSSDPTPNDVYKRLEPLLPNDRLLILSINKETQYQGWLDKEAWDWLSVQLNDATALYQ